MRILLVNQYAGSPSLGMEYRPHWMAREWIKAGHDVLVVAGSHSHLRRVPLSPGRTDVEGVPYLVLPTIPYERNGARRFANILSFRQALYRNHRRLQAWTPDAVIASSTHPMDVRPSVKLARSVDARFAYEIHDLWPLTPRLLGGMPPWHPMIAWMQREEDFGYRNADTVVSLLPGTEHYALAHGMRDGRWVWIPNGISTDPSDAEPAPAYHVDRLAEFAGRWRRIVIYAGTIGLSNAIEQLLLAASHAEIRGIGLVLVGDGLARTELQSKYATSANVAWLDPVRRTQVRSLLQFAHAGYAGALPSPLYEFGISRNSQDLWIGVSRDLLISS